MKGNLEKKKKFILNISRMNKQELKMYKSKIEKRMQRCTDILVMGNSKTLTTVQREGLKEVINVCIEKLREIRRYENY